MKDELEPPEASGGNNNVEKTLTVCRRKKKAFESAAPVRLERSGECQDNFKEK